jgi:hypothetical protein
MADNNYNVIQPVESLQNIAGLTPVKQRKERDPQKKQKQHNRQQQQDQEQTPEDTFEMKQDNTIGEPEKDTNSIDYCA